MKRYFYFAATYAVSVRECVQSFGLEKETFPTRTDLHDVVKLHSPGARQIVILSITELTKPEMLGLLPADHEFI